MILGISALLELDNGSDDHVAEAYFEDAEDEISSSADSEDYSDQNQNHSVNVSFSASGMTSQFINDDDLDFYTEVKLAETLQVIDLRRLS